VHQWRFRKLDDGGRRRHEEVGRPFWTAKDVYDDGETKNGLLRRVQSRCERCCHGDSRVMNGEDDATELRGGYCRLANFEGATTVAAFSGVGAMGWLRFWRAVAVVGHGGGSRGGWRLRHGDG